MSTVMFGTLFVPLYSYSVVQGERSWNAGSPCWTEEQAVASALSMSGGNVDRIVISRVENMPMYEAPQELKSLSLRTAKSINYGEEATDRHHTGECEHAEQDTSGIEVLGRAAGDDLQRVDSDGPRVVYSGRADGREGVGGQDQ